MVLVDYSLHECGVSLAARVRRESATFDWLLSLYLLTRQEVQVAQGKIVGDELVTHFYLLSVLSCVEDVSRRDSNLGWNPLVGQLQVVVVEPVLELNGLGFSGLDERVLLSLVHFDAIEFDFAAAHLKVVAFFHEVILGEVKEALLAFSLIQTEAVRIFNWH